jgi:hypothetical protein
VLRSLRSHIGLAKLPEVLFEGMLLRHAGQALLSWSQMRVGTMLCPFNRFILDSFDPLGPIQQGFIMRKVLLELMDIT